MLPNAVLLSPRLSAGAKILYALLRHYARQAEACYPGRERPARELPASARSLSHYLDELRAARLVTVQRRGQGKTNVYWLAPVPDAPARRLLAGAGLEDDPWESAAGVASGAAAGESDGQDLPF
jgi:hypothetical protein